MNQLLKKKFLIWALLSLNLLFAFIIGFIIPYMESETRNFLALFIIPLLLLLNYVYLNRYQYFLRKIKEKEGLLDEVHEEEN